MKRKISSFLMACLFVALSCPSQILHATPPKKASPGQSQTSSTNSNESSSSNSGQETSDAQTETTSYNIPERTESIAPGPDRSLPQRTESIVSGSYRQIQIFPAHFQPQITMEQLQEQPNSESTDLEVKKISENSSNPALSIEDTITIKSSMIPENLKAPTVSDGDLSYPTELFLRSPTMISSNNPSVRPKVHFNWLTISAASPVVFENLDISGKIQITAHAKVIFRNCNIHNLDHNECVVEIFDNSSGLFENCSLDNDLKVCVVIRDRSFAYFNRCTVDHSANTGILVQDSSSIQAFNCDFSRCTRYAIYLFRGGKAFLQNCTFHNISGKPIFSLNNSEVEARGCHFDTCQGGAICMAESSKLQIMECDFQNIDGCAISLLKDSSTKVSDCMFEQINGNGVNFDISTGEVTDCTFDSFNFPAISVSGLNANPTIKRCTIRNVSEHSFIAVRCNAAPIFEDIHIGGFTSETPVISCSDFSGSVFKGIDFDISDKTPEIIACNAAKVKVVPSPKCKVECVHENGHMEEYFPVIGDHEYCLRIFERTSSQAMMLPPTNTHIYPEFIDIQNVQQYEHPDAKVISCLCGHTITSCPICKSHDHDVFTFDGENLICKNCGVLDFKHNAFKCSLCKFPIRKVLRPFDDNDTCVICLENSPNVIFLPCGHKCTCHECTHECIRHKKICPICQKTIQTFRYDFFTSKHK